MTTTQTQTNPITLWGAQEIDITSAISTPPPPRKTVLAGLPIGAVGILYGAGARGKSYLTLAIGSAVADPNTHHLFGHPDWPVGVGPVLLANIEDPKEEVERRMYYMGQLKYAFNSDLHVLAPERAPRLLVEIAPGQIVSNESGWTELTQLITDIQPVLVILDPLIKLHGLNENSNNSMIHFIDRVAGLARQMQVAILVVHHSAKAGRNATGDVSAARGAAVIIDEARWSAELGPLSAQEAKNIPEPDRWRYAALRVTKANYGPVPQPLYLYRGREGVLVRSQHPDHVVVTPATSEHEDVNPPAPPPPRQPAPADESNGDEVPFGPELDREVSNDGTLPDWWR